MKSEFIKKNNYYKTMKWFSWTVIFLIFCSLIFVISLLSLVLKPNNEILVFSSQTAFNSDLIIFILMIIFGSFAAIALLILIVWILILKIKKKNGIKISLPDKEYDSYVDLATDHFEGESDV